MAPRSTGGALTDGPDPRLDSAEEWGEEYRREGRLKHMGVHRESIGLHVVGDEVLRGGNETSWRLRGTLRATHIGSAKVVAE